MKKKILAILLGVIMSLTCVSALAACTGEDGSNKSGVNGETNEQKTTVDNFEEWYQAIMDTINSDNYMIHVTYNNSSGENRIGDWKREGNKYQKQINSESKPTGYGVIDEKMITEYTYSNVTEGDNSSGKWVPYEFKESADSVYGVYLEHFRFNVICFGMLDEGMSIFMGALLKHSDDLEIKNETDLKTNAAIRYEEVTYDVAKGVYIVTNSDYGETVILKFLNGKISYMYVQTIQGDWWAQGTYTFTYGGASVTIPDEVLAVKPEQ